MTDAELIARNLCPVCQIERRANINVRRAVQEHIRISKDPAHIMWRNEHYAIHFKRGGNMVKTETTEEDIRTAVKKAFGNEWATRIVCQ